MNKSKSKKSLFSRINAWLHLWLGIFAGIILVFVALTGTVVVYGDEIIEWSAGKSRFIQEVKSEKIPLETLIQKVKKEIPKSNISEATVYKNPKRALRLRAFAKGKGLSFIYVDQYTGQILKNDRTANFFYIMAHLHASFMWHGTGEWIVDIATIIFLIELISGIILWWPRKWTKHTRDASFKIKWKAKFKRVNYDLHNVLGFYASLLALILTVTGLLIAFKPMAEGTAKLFGGDIKTKWQKTMPKADFTKETVPAYTIFEKEFEKFPNQKMAQLWTYNTDSIGFYMVTTATKMGLKSAENAHVSILDKYSGKELDIKPTYMKGEYIENNVWQLHMGTWMGPIGKLFTFICGLVCTSLPITGFLIWWLKGKKKKRKITIA
ncbi:MAG: PepSY domain-containing protein [Pseudopedobacter saltans]|uniref:PepSY domain-containing protein n=1 Tax=Pseudopedobacter saltans TaxID=151895 RepID=A0A2W5F5X0_9SPHI|nr:MAG: PepSY domain-containing protein [Pseudopedobacter saltans]